MFCMLRNKTNVFKGFEHIEKDPDFEKRIKKRKVGRRTASYTQC